MNSKGKSSAETSDGATLVPRLRFPEFQTADGWKEVSLQKLARPVTDRATTGDADNVLSLSGEHGLVLQSDYFGKKIASDSTDRYLKIRKDDFVYNDRTTKASSFGTIKRLSNYSGGIVSPIYKCFRFQPSENPAFWEWYFESGSHNPALGGLVNEGARAGRFNISVTQFLSTNAWRPDEAEQHRIADCLDSADALIAAQGRKVEALRAHKKGLLQQLFPLPERVENGIKVPAETQPRRRFQEFEGPEKWQEAKLQAACNLQAGKFVAASEIQERSAGGLFPCFGGNGLRGYTTSFTHSGKYPLIGRQGALCGNVRFANGKFHATEHAVVASPKKGVSVDWLFYLLDHLDLNQFATGQAQPGLSVDVLNNVMTSIPQDEAEQQRIADCLTSLDDLIAAEIRKLDTLKTHKKGLMQQLFPSVGEDNA